ncbi:MAG: hypothetical protein WD273_09395 [Trueperaceae bacterium]
MPEVEASLVELVPSLKRAWTVLKPNHVPIYLPVRNRDLLLKMLDSDQHYVPDIQGLIDDLRAWSSEWYLGQESWNDRGKWFFAAILETLYLKSFSSIRGFVPGVGLSGERENWKDQVYLGKKWGVRHFHWLALSQARGLSATKICVWESERSSDPDLEDRSVAKAIKKTAQWMGLIRRPPKRGRPRRS